MLGGGLLLAGLLAVWLVPAALRTMPTRYALRLPESLQAMALPADPTPILPTVAAPADAAERLLVPVTAPTSVPSDATATPPPSPTPAPLAVSQTDATTPTPMPTPTAVPLPTEPPPPKAARLNGITHKFQDWNNCGPATMAMALSYYGLGLSQYDTAAVLKPNEEDRNVGPDEMAAYVNDQTELGALFRTNGSAETLRAFIANGIPVIIELGIEPPGEFRWLGWYGHYLLPVAYDDVQQQFWVYDSWFGTSEEPLQNADPDGRVLTYAELETLWPQFNRNYVVLYSAEQADLVARIIGDDMDDARMWQNNLAQAQNDATAAPENAFFWFNLGTVHTALGDFDSATLAYDKARSIGLPWRMLWYQFGPYEAYYQVGRYDDVVLLADRTLEERPLFEESFYYRGLARMAAGDERAAQADWEQAAALNPNYRPPVDALAALQNGN